MVVSKCKSKGFWHAFLKSVSSVFLFTFGYVPKRKYYDRPLNITSDSDACLADREALRGDWLMVEKDLANACEKLGVLHNGR